MKLALAIVAGCTLHVAGWAQPMPRAVTFAWDAPLSLVDAIGYELQWGPQQSAQLPLHITEFTVGNFPLALSQPVAVRTLGNGTNSEPVEIRIFNVIANFEESTGSGWAVVETAQITREVKSNAMIRVRLEGALR
jgi:hypothetical protein